MLPAAVGVPSPINSPPMKSSSFVQNPNSIPDATPHCPFNYTGFSYVNFSESAENVNPSGLDDGIGRGFATPSTSQGSTVASGRPRPRPRFLKLRKQSAAQHARSRSRNAASEVGSGFNPFRSVSENLDQVGSSVSASKVVMDSSNGVESGARKFEDAGFVFGAKRSDPATVLTTGLGAAAGNAEESGSRVKVTIEKETAVGRTDQVEFVFSAKVSNMDSKSCQDRKEDTENAAETDFGDEGTVKLESELLHGKLSSTEFVFRANQSHLASSLSRDKRESSNCEENLSFDDGEDRTFRTGGVCRKQSSFDFLSGGNLRGDSSNLNMEKQGPIDNMRKSDHFMNIKTETASSNSNTNSYQDNHLSSDDKSKIGSGSTDSASSSFSASPAFTLPDEMKKLNINEFERVGRADNAKGLKNSSVNWGSAFVFGSTGKPGDSFSVSSGTNSDVELLKTFEKNSVPNGTYCNYANNSTGTSCSEPSSIQENIRNFHWGKIPESEAPDNSQMNHATEPFSLSFGPDSHPSNNASTTESMNVSKDKCDSDFANVPEGSKEFFMEFKPPTWDPSCFKENLVPKLNEKLESMQKCRTFKEKGSKSMRRKVKSHPLNKKQTRHDNLPKKSNPLETPTSSGTYSPMDFSPYQETSADDQNLEVPAESNETSIPDNNYVSSSLHSTNSNDCKDEHLAAVGRGADINTTAHIHENRDISFNGSSSVSGSYSSGVEQAWSTIKPEHVCGSGIAGAARTGFVSNTERKKTDQCWFTPGLGDVREQNFTFSAPSAGESAPTSLKHRQKKKYRSKKGCKSFVASPNLNEKVGFSFQLPSLTTASTSTHSNVRTENIDHMLKQGDVVCSATIEETCDTWRVRGNCAYKDGDLSKAEEFYTKGINSVPSSGMSECLIKPLSLCYSNRAATRMGLGRIREALGDCLMATTLDPAFLKVQMRTANCHLLLGEIQNAEQCFNKCLEPGNVVCLDRRVALEAAEGLRKAQIVAECINSCAALLKEGTSDAASAALELLAKALSISLHSEKLLQMKAEALCLLQKHDAAIELCNQSQYLAEKNFASANSRENYNNSTPNSYLCVRLWRWSMISRCYFHLGGLETSLDVLEKLQHDVSLNEKCAIENIEDSLSLAAPIRKLLDCKTAGNEAFKSGKYTEAIEHYTIALSSNVQSRPFAAICFCNRAAAHQALEQIADAILDCSVAMALDENYAKAISRRAVLYEMVRDYGQAASDLKRLISILEKNELDEKAKSGTPGGSKELRQARQRLLLLEEQAKKGISLNVYLILGIKQSVTASDVKKAYHKAALRHHPDKAGQFLARSETGDESQVWKDILQKVHMDADGLFKMIGEAYAVLSDPAKRSEYDLGEEKRKASKESNSSRCRRSSEFNGYGRPSGVYRSPFDRSSNRRHERHEQRHERDSWKTYGNSYSQW